MMSTITNDQRFFAFTRRLQLDAIRRGVPLDDQATQQLYAEFAALEPWAALTAALDQLTSCAADKLSDTFRDEFRDDALGPAFSVVCTPDVAGALQTFDGDPELPYLFRDDARGLAFTVVCSAESAESLFHAITSGPTPRIAFDYARRERGGGLLSQQLRASLEHLRFEFEELFADQERTGPHGATWSRIGGLERDLDRLVLAVEALEGSECRPRRDLEHEEWLRIGQCDRARARSLWVRFTRLGPSHVSESGLVYEGPVVAVELCSGRDGGDEYVKITPGELAPPLFCKLFDTLDAQVWAQAVDGLDENQT
jgi:hypothetical protein